MHFAYTSWLWTKVGFDETSQRVLLSQQAVTGEKPLEVAPADAVAHAHAPNVPDPAQINHGNADGNASGNGPNGREHSRRKWVRKRDPSKATGLRHTTELRHSMVSTCVVMTNPLEQVDKPQQWLVEQLVLPPKPVETTDNICVGKSLCLQLEGFATGMPLGDFLQSANVQRFKVVQIFMFCDRASSNILMMKKFKSWINDFSLCHADLGLHIIFDTQFCQLHGTSRIGVKVQNSSFTNARPVCQHMLAYIGICDHPRKYSNNLTRINVIS